MKYKYFWNKEIAINIAKKYDIKLKKIHWKIIYYFRSFYFKNKILPNIRLILIYLNKNNNNKKYNSIYLFKLFSINLLKTISDISGLKNKLIVCF